MNSLRVSAIVFANALFCERRFDAMVYKCMCYMTSVHMFNESLPLSSYPQAQTMKRPATAIAKRPAAAIQERACRFMVLG